MLKLYDKQTGRLLGAMTEQDLRFLAEQLEEESPEDTDYYVNRETLDLLAERGADPRLLGVLRDALGEREDMEVRWEDS